MPGISVDNYDTVLYFEDTGAPPGSTDYTTIVLIHGSIFHSGIFHRLIPHAAAHNLRLVFVNTRDYPGSSPYSQRDLDTMLNPNHQIQEVFIHDQGHEIAMFLEKYIRANNLPLPRVSDVHGEGKVLSGVVLTAWSMGNAILTSTLANAVSLSEDTRTLLDQYLRSVVLYDASAPSLGALPAEGTYHPMRDTSLSPKERGDKFLPWVSSYFPAVSSLSEVTPAFLAARSALPDDTFRPTVKGMSAPELASTTHFGALASNLALRQIDPAIYARNLRRALVDTGGVWQNVKALVVWCDMSVVDCIWGAKACADLVAEKHGVDHIQRAIEFIKIEGANHFAHWDQPEKLLNVLSKLT